MEQTTFHGPGTVASPVSAAGADEYRALVHGAAFRTMGERVAVRVVGADRIEFFQGMCSADLKGAGVGGVVPALLLTEHAHVIADFYAWISADALLIDIEASLWPRARAHLDRLLVADDVEFIAAERLALIEVLGPKARDAVVAAGAEGAGGLDQLRFAERGAMLVGRVARVGADGYTIVAPDEEARAMFTLLRNLRGNYCEVSAAATEVARVENGIARVGVDTNNKTIALEARLERAISSSKGCYVGQETIERVNARGGLKRRLYGLRVVGDRAPRRNSAVELAGKEVGRISSCALSPTLGALALSILHQSAWQPATMVVIKDQEGDLSATVSDLPFRAQVN
ncbi:MAG: YgfZ/GcvT domain-containing protein [Candidatus Binataceae bacterium]